MKPIGYEKQPRNKFLCTPFVTQVCNLKVLLELQLLLDYHVAAVFKKSLSSPFDQGIEITAFGCRPYYCDLCFLTSAVKTAMHLHLKSTPVLSNMHRWPVGFWVEFKVLVLTCRALNSLRPPCLRPVQYWHGCGEQRNSSWHHLI